MLHNVEGRVGNIDIARIYDSSLRGETMQTWFPKFDREALRPHEHWLCPDHYDAESGHFEMPVHSWLFQVGGKNVLIDSCIGNDRDRPLVSEMHRLNTRYLDRLHATGLRPEDIDYVLCSHLHIDHVGWNTQLLDGRWVPTFPNARYIFNRTEYEATKDAAASDTVPQFIRNVFADAIYPVVEAGKVDLVEDGHELLGCLRLEPAPGHSPGHVRIELRSAGALGIFSGDILHSPAQVPMWEWSSKVCSDAALSAESRRSLLEFAASEGGLILAGHFVSPYVGRIRDMRGDFRIDFGW
jgi:glyoxylase-like metal-dependent hydrolase (beta-lactamase superfamily II)